MTVFQRARKPEEKDERRRAILLAARDLASEVGARELSLNELGRRSGVSKPNIYRYFESREEVLFRLFIHELEEVVSEVDETLGAVKADVPSVAAFFTRVYLARPLFCQLLGMMSETIEHNLGVETIAAGKAEMNALFARVVGALARALPWLSEADALWASQSIALYVAALWPATHPSPAAAEVLARAEFCALQPDAARDLGRLVEVLLTGLEALNRSRSAVPTAEGTTDGVLVCP